MSIQQYYLQNANSYLQACIASLSMLAALLGSFLLMPAKPPFILAAVPFLFFTFIHFQGFLLNTRRSRESSPTDSANGQAPAALLQQEHLLLGFAPAPALKMLLFFPDGMLAGLVREEEEKKWRWFLPYVVDKHIRKNYVLFDTGGRFLARVAVMGAKANVFNREGKLIGRFDGKARRGLLLGDNRLFSVKQQSALFTDLRFVKDEGLVFSQLQRGWMKTEWQKCFSLNTPVLSFDTDTCEYERLMTLAAIAVEYSYVNN